MIVSTISLGAWVFVSLLPGFSKSFYVSTTLKYYKNYLTYELSSLSSDSKMKAGVK